MAAFFDGTAQAALWILALSTRLRRAVRLRRARASASHPGHFAERFALIVIIALGESIVAIGTGLEGELDGGTVVAALLGLVVAFALWWAYFDVVALVSERHFRESRGEQRLRIARDSYSYLHLPMIAGIVLVALGVKKTLERRRRPARRRSRRWPSSGGSRSTTPGTSGSGCGTCARSTGRGSWRCSPASR